MPRGRPSVASRSTSRACDSGPGRLACSVPLLTRVDAFLSTGGPAVLRATVFSRCRVRPWAPSRRCLVATVVIGVVAAVLPLIVVSRWLVPLVWLGWLLALEPINARRGRPSWLGDLARGDASKLLALLASGAVCGVLWEFWNYWATTKWTYTVPYAGNVKIFEMPVLGYLGFPPFALECYAMYHAVRGVLAADGDTGATLI